MPRRVIRPRQAQRRQQTQPASGAPASLVDHSNVSRAMILGNTMSNPSKTAEAGHRNFKPDIEIIAENSFSTRVMHRRSASIEAMKLEHMRARQSGSESLPPIL